MVSWELDDQEGTMALWSGLPVELPPEPRRLSARLALPLCGSGDLDLEDMRCRDI
jgi:hypothetical protein